MNTMMEYFSDCAERNGINDKLFINKTKYKYN